MRRLFIIGLDCAPPDWIYYKWRDELPNLSALMEQSVWGMMESTIPPITVPAWYCMFSGKTPGELGIYGFRNRADYNYHNLQVTNSFSIKDKAIWNYLSQRGKTSVVIGVPPTYPPKPLKGYLISGFLTPSNETSFTFPSSLKQEILDFLGEEYIFDVKNFRTDEKDRLLKDIYRMSEQRFKVVRYMMKNKKWDFFVFVDMGPDRFNHGFWKFFDPSHPLHEPGNPYQDVGIEYYKFIDKLIGDLLNELDEDVDLMVVSDHGAKAMKGGLPINQWLEKGGFLKFKTKPAEGTKIDKADIDWSRTYAWGEGGYYSRIFMNVKGREPHGIIDKKDYEKVRQDLIDFIKSIPDEEGKDMGTKVFRPEEIYPEVRRIPPDLIVLVGDLDWRAIGTVGYSEMYLHRNDTGPDDANHAQYALFIYRSKELPTKGNIGEISIYDIFPTISDIFGLNLPARNGQSLFKKLKEEA